MMEYSIEDFGAVGDGNHLHAGPNTIAIQNTINKGRIDGVDVYVPRRSGFPVYNGQLRMPGDHMKIRGDSTMGSSFGGPASVLVGIGPGHTLLVSGGGCTVDGLSFQNDGQQSGGDASVMITDQQCYLRNLYIESPNIGMALKFPSGQEGELWMSDILVGGSIRTAVASLNAGNSAIQMRHVLAYNSSASQPPYGVVVTSCGELIMQACDIDNCGTNLALVPGLGGVKGQWTNAVFISDCLFDNGNGPGNVYIGPQSDGWVFTVKFTNVWTSTVNNGEGAWNTNGFTFDGSMSKPIGLGVLPLEDITRVNCVGRSMRNHCGVYAKGVNGLTIADSTFGGGNFAGIQLAPGCSDYVVRGNKLGAYTPPSVGSLVRGNDAYGLIVEPNGFGIIQGNMARGNGRGGFWNIAPNPLQQISGNVWA